MTIAERQARDAVAEAAIAYVEWSTRYAKLVLGRDREHLGEMLHQAWERLGQAVDHAEAVRDADRSRKPVPAVVTGFTLRLALSALTGRFWSGRASTPGTGGGTC